MSSFDSPWKDESIDYNDMAYKLSIRVNIGEISILNEVGTIINRVIINLILRVDGRRSLLGARVISSFNFNQSVSIYKWFQL
jgi:hypothetical protein